MTSNFRVSLVGFLLSRKVQHHGSPNYYYYFKLQAEFCSKRIGTVKIRSPSFLAGECLVLVMFSDVGISD